MHERLAAFRTEPIPAHDTGGTGDGGAIKEYRLVREEHVDGAVGKGSAGDEQQIAPFDCVLGSVAPFHEYTAFYLTNIIRVEVDEPDFGFCIQRLGQKIGRAHV